MNLRIVALDGLDAKALPFLQDLPGADFDFLKDATLDQKIEKAKSAHVILVRSATRVTQEFLDQCHDLKLVVRAGVGLDNVDVAAATQKGVIVMNTPSGNTVTTAEHAISMMMSLARQIPQATASMKQGKWEKKKFMGHELCNKNLGVIGLGNIGRIVADRAVGLGMQVLAYDPYVSEEQARKQSVEKVSLEELYKRADFITVHVPLTDHTHHLISRDAFSQMKKGVFLIHCARGGIVDEEALLKSLETGHVAGAALDVFEKEPPDSDSKLVLHPHVICTPHLGAATEEAQVAVSIEAAEQIRDYVAQGMIRNAVNHPAVTASRLRQVGPYVSLAERMGDFLGQWSSEDEAYVSHVELKFQGVESQDQDLLTLSFLKGFLTPIFGDHVNFVNAKTLAQGNDISILQASGDLSDQFSVVIQATIKRKDSDRLFLEGVLFGKNEPRFTVFNQFKTDARPEGWVLVTINKDVPNMVGQIGTILGKRGVNIANMNLGRGPGGTDLAFALTTVDSEIPKEVLDELRKVQGIVLARQFHIESTSL